MLFTRKMRLGPCPCVVAFAAAWTVVPVRSFAPRPTTTRSLWPAVHRLPPSSSSAAASPPSDGWRSSSRQGPPPPPSSSSVSRPRRGANNRRLSSWSLSSSQNSNNNSDERRRQQQQRQAKNADKPRIRVSRGIDLDRGGGGGPVGWLFSGLTSDVTSIALGLGGLAVLLVGRLLLDTTTSATETMAATAAAIGGGGGSDAETAAAAAAVDLAQSLGEATRVNLLAVFACGAILLNGVSKLDVQSAMAERVRLVGVNRPSAVVLPTPTPADEDDGLAAAAWVLESVLTASPASTAVLLQAAAADDKSWQVQGYAGIVPESISTSSSTAGALQAPLPLPESTATPILDRLRRENTESYLPTLQALPGRTEFAYYLPVNTQAVLLLPVMAAATRSGCNDGTCRRRRRPAVLVLGANQARSFTPRDIAWCQVMANRLWAET